MEERLTKHQLIANGFVYVKDKWCNEHYENENGIKLSISRDNENFFYEFARLKFKQIKTEDHLKELLHFFKEEEIY